mmetsp:Transcript_116151/g.339676  ORF Transcript_116151/g.339676 Transcript_116151/m.339676 type:complete len:106 (+) Transcript_116151:1284-1601(+)
MRPHRKKALQAHRPQGLQAVRLQGRCAQVPHWPRVLRQQVRAPHWPRLLQQQVRAPPPRPERRFPEALRCRRQRALASGRGVLGEVNLGCRVRNQCERVLSFKWT